MEFLLKLPSYIMLVALGIGAIVMLYMLGKETVIELKRLIENL